VILCQTIIVHAELFPDAAAEEFENANITFHKITKQRFCTYYNYINFIYLATPSCIQFENPLAPVFLWSRAFINI
jgi:hypothetical protein